MHRMVLSALLILLLPSVASGGVDILDRYVEEGLRENLALKQKDISYRQSVEALAEARGMFMPSIGLEARYSRAGGGREILFPVGDLMNPVYETLNELLAVHGFPPGGFPHLENEVIPFLREEEQDTKIRVVQPLFQPAIYYNYRIKSELADSRRAEREAFRRKLEVDIRTAYFNYLKLRKLAWMLEETAVLLSENLDVSETLHRNGKVTVDAVYRARAELSALERRRLETGRDLNSASSYFNFLLNRPLDGEIEIPGGDLETERPAVTLEEAYASALGRREEIRQMESAVRAAEGGVRLAGSSYLPAVSLVFDYGIQGEEYRFTGEDDYWMGSIIMQWDLFSGLQKKARRDQAALEKKIYENGLEQLRSNIRLQVRQAFDNLDVALKSIESARDRLKSSRRSFEIVRTKYENGASPQIEYLDARNDLTRAEVSLITAEYDYQIRVAELEYIAALKE